jgi:hypothetical protein
VIAPRARIEEVALNPAFATTPIWLRGAGLEFVHEFVAMRVPVSRSPDDSDGPVPAGALRLARELDEELTLRADEALVQNVARFARIGIDLDPAYDEVRASATRSAVRARVAFDPRLLALVAAVFDAPSVLLEVRGTKAPLVIRPNVADAGEEALLAATITSR